MFDATDGMMLDAEVVVGVVVGVVVVVVEVVVEVVVVVADVDDSDEDDADCDDTVGDNGSMAVTKRVEWDDKDDWRRR